MTKPANRLSVREEKAAALDNFVKTERARVKALNDAKRARLKALRLAHEESNDAVRPEPAGAQAVLRKRKTATAGRKAARDASSAPGQMPTPGDQP